MEGLFQGVGPRDEDGGLGLWFAGNSSNVQGLEFQPETKGFRVEGVGITETMTSVW